MNISKMTLGTVQLGTPYGIANRIGQPDRNASAALLERAMSAGITCFDTARFYGEAEEILGHYFAGRAGKPPVLVTKARIEPGDVASDADVDRALRASLERSLDRLQVSNVAVFMLHTPDVLRTAHGPAVLKTLRSLKEEGRIGCAGISLGTLPQETFPPEWETVLDETFGAVQLPVSALDQRWIRSGGLSQLRESGKTIFIRSVFLQGLIFLEEERMPPELQPAAEAIRQLRETAEQEGMSLAQLALSFIRDLPETDSLVIGAETVEQLEDNIALMAGPALSNGAAARIRSLAQLPESILNPARWPNAQRPTPELNK